MHISATLPEAAEECECDWPPKDFRSHKGRIYEIPLDLFNPQRGLCISLSLLGNNYGRMKV
jgi:hypothetical protein